jgi:ABC-type glutathione transport system ATPase component
VGVAVQVEGLTKSFGSQNIWSDVTLTLPPGEISVLLGPSGTGKYQDNATVVVFGQYVVRSVTSGTQAAPEGSECTVTPEGAQSCTQTVQVQMSPRRRRLEDQRPDAAHDLLAVRPRGPSPAWRRQRGTRTGIIDARNAARRVGAVLPGDVVWVATPPDVDSVREQG